jgi:outer membrane protein OmpA-like peptidoglycan-associated protein/type II secretory pathway predicted ATPase ExeA
MIFCKHFEQMHEPIDIDKDTKQNTGFDPAEALEGLCRALEADDAFALLTGPAGSGKSMLVGKLLPRLTCMVCRVTIPDKEMTSEDFRRFLAEALCLETNVQSRGAFLLKIRDFLMSEAVKDHRIIFVLESIQCLSRKLFKELELLADIGISDRNPITFLFVGLTDAESIFSDPYLAKISNRIGVKTRLKDASCDDFGNLDDVRRHIRQRLQKAGTAEPVFDAFAVREVYRLSRGRLWAVDGLCDLALLNGALYGIRKIPATVVREYAQQLGLPVTCDDDRASFQRNLESVRRKLQSALVDKAPHQTEGAIPGDSGREPDAVPSGMNQFQEGDWEDRALMRYIDGAHLSRSPVRQRRQGQWYDSSTTYDRSIDDDWEKDTVAGRSELNRSSFVWGALSVISILLLCFAVWVQFFDESGAVLRFFTDSAAKVESTLISAWRGITGGASPESAAKPSLPSSETIAPESGDPVLPGRDSTTDAWPPHAMVQFDSNSYVIGPQYGKLLDRVAAYLEHYPQQRVSLQGYSDNIGDRDYNLFISKYRALVVKYYLIDKGVPAERMQILGMGEGSPVGSNDTPEGRRYNRRVEIELIPDTSSDPETQTGGGGG